MYHMSLVMFMFNTTSALAQLMLQHTHSRDDARTTARNWRLSHSEAGTSLRADQSQALKNTHRRLTTSALYKKYLSLLLCIG